MAKYDHTEHIAILTEIITLQSIVTETLDKIRVAKAKEKKNDGTENRKNLYHFK